MSDHSSHHRTGALLEIADRVSTSMGSMKVILSGEWATTRGFVGTTMITSQAGLVMYVNAALDPETESGEMICHFGGGFKGIEHAEFAIDLSNRNDPRVTGLLDSAPVGDRGAALKVEPEASGALRRIFRRLGRALTEWTKQRRDKSRRRDSRGPYQARMVTMLTGMIFLVQLALAILQGRRQCLRVGQVIIRGAKATRKRFLKDLRAANMIINPRCGAPFIIPLGTVIINDPHLLTMERPFLCAEAGSPRSQERRLFRYHHSTIHGGATTDVTAYYVANLVTASCAQGCGGFFGGRPGVIMSNGASTGSVLFAHELGHVLSLKHVGDDERNLMHVPVTRNRPNITSDQCRRALASPFLSRCQLDDLGRVFELFLGELPFI